MGLSEQQRRHVEGIASLVTHRDTASIRQGVELASALGDDQVFAALLDGVTPSRAPVMTGDRFPAHRRFPSPGRAQLFETGDGDQALRDLAMVHLLAASNLVVRSQVRSIALGTPKRKFSNPAPELWLDGLERFPSLTHLDLHLSRADDELDLSPLENFPQLTHLRIRGPVSPGPIPAMSHLELINAVRLRFDPSGHYRALRSIRGQFSVDEPITPEMMPNLVDVEARDGIRLAGFETLRSLFCYRGEVELVGCRRVEHLRASGAVFNAPDLRQVGLLEQLSVGLDVSQFETIDELKLNRTCKFRSGNFPPGATLVDPRVVLWGPDLVDLGNIGELPGLEELLMSRVRAPVSLETLRHAKDLRILDIRNSPGITDLSPLIELPRLEAIIINDPDRIDVPPELEGRIRKLRRPTKRLGAASSKRKA